MASHAITLLLAGSMAFLWAFEQDRRDNHYSSYPTTQSSGGYYSNGHYYSGSHPWFGSGGSYGGYGNSSGSSHSFSGISHGGFGSTGHSMGGHS